MTYSTAREPIVGPSQEAAQLVHPPEATAVLSVICGSFRRDPDGLRTARDELTAAGCTVLSPRNIEWAHEVDGFVLNADELDDDPADIEQGHLTAMRCAHFVWLHAPGGYVGRSGAMELGYAHALGLPVFASELPGDVTLAPLVRKVPHERTAVAVAREMPQAPALGLESLQRYYHRVSLERGWDEEDARECLLFLSEELGELTTAVRRSGESSVEAASEMADLQLYLVHLANAAGVDLGAAVIEKERINAIRFGGDVQAAA